MKLENLNFEDVYDLMYIMRKPANSVHWDSPKKIVDVMKNAEKKVTIHFYRLGGYRKDRKTLLDCCQWSYNQLYIAMKDKEIFCCRTNGNSSGSRQYHNAFIDYFLQDKKLQKEVPTAVLVTHKDDLLAYYFYPSYAYVNHDIGSNWPLPEDIRKRLKTEKLPHSYQSFEHHWSDGKEIWFKTTREKILVYKALQKDALSQRIRRIRRGKNFKN